ncbi:MAG: hypothetical protein IJZ15_06915 [Oscillospiraceae bacterium]|nr:hypothetical protein [Oscillospiraceae bacterium]
MFKFIFAFMVVFTPVYGLYYYLKERDYKEYIFNIVFALLCGVWGFLLMANGIVGKVLGAVMFACLGWFISFIFSKLTGLIPKRAIMIILRIIPCLAMVYIMFITGYVPEPEENFDLPAGSSYSCAYCGEKASKEYGGDFLCYEHYYLAKGMDGDFNP